MSVGHTVWHGDDVASAAVLVNGLPGSGKTTLARQLADVLDAQLLSKDAIKEALAELLRPGVEQPIIGAIAMETLWQLAAATPGTVVLDAYWFRPRDLQHAAAGLRVLGTELAVEVWCDIPSGLARERYQHRCRSPLHEDARRLAADWDGWAGEAAPLGLTPVVRVDTTAGGDVTGIADAVRVVLRLDGTAR